MAYTIEQSWHRVPGGTAVAALEVARELLDVVAERSAAGSAETLDLVGVTMWHRRRPPEPFVPPMPVRRQLLPPKLGYDVWARLAGSDVGARVAGDIAGIGGWVDVVHATTPLIPPTRRPLVATVHDLVFLTDPDRFTSRGARLMTRAFDVVRDRAQLVLCSSTATRLAVIDAGVDRARTRLVPLGVRVEPSTDAEQREARARIGVDGPFVLAVGTLEPRKNLPRLIEAHRSANLGTRLVVVGPKGWGDEALPGDVIATGFVPDATLRGLYAAASLLCYPSLHEGFGLPILEAMAHGCPVVTSRGSSTEEVAGGAAVLTDPTDTDDIIRAMREALDRHEALADAGRRRAAEMTWRRTAQLTLDAYRELAP
ncbi:MAG: glycosyltransferase family 4 protein [Acidimicrobiia bacterium]